MSVRQLMLIGIAKVRNSIEADLRHGVTREEVLAFFDKIRNDRSFASLRKKSGATERLEEIEKYFTGSTPNRY